MNINELNEVVNSIRTTKGGLSLHINSIRNSYTTDPDIANGLSNFSKSLENGRSYLVGNDMDIHTFRKRYRSSIATWMKYIVMYANDHPSEKLSFTIDKGSFGKLEYHVFKRADYVEIRLPYHDMGGEKSWITKDMRTKYLVDVD